jgi:uncharacterized protein (TIGR01244 family)
MTVQSPVTALQRWAKATRETKVFLAAACAGFVIMLGVVSVSRKEPIEIKPLGLDINVTSQLQLRDIRGLKGRFATVIDLRPDGEAADQPSSEMVASNCKAWGLKFAYVPVQHGTIPDKSVRALAQAIEANPKPILLYCRSGKRAVRTYCLAEASRPGGASLESIVSAAHAAGQSADDLTSELKSRIAKRSSKPGPPHD